MAFCAVSVGGTIVFNAEGSDLSGIEKDFMQQSIEELSLRANEMREDIVPREITGQNVVLVVMSGFTLDQQFESRLTRYGS